MPVHWALPSGAHTHATALPFIVTNVQQVGRGFVQLSPRPSPGTQEHTSLTCRQLHGPLGISGALPLPLPLMAAGAPLLAGGGLLAWLGDAPASPLMAAGVAPAAPPFAAPDVASAPAVAGFVPVFACAVDALFAPAAPLFAPAVPARLIGVQPNTMFLSRSIRPPGHEESPSVPSSPHAATNAQASAKPKVRSRFAKGLEIRSEALALGRSAK